MPPRKKAKPDYQVTDYRHDETRTNIPPAGLAGQGRVAEVPKTRYSYDPHLPPVLRFDSSGAADRLPELLEIARQRAMDDDEARVLAEALRVHQPWLEWAGKREKPWFEVDPVALHIHERVSAQAIIATARREPLQRSFFADPELDYREAVKFYQYPMEWTNRLILGDSLTVMHSLARREDLAGKVQMIYIDPPYGINFRSNFQSQISQRDVKDKADDLTREPEQVKAYRDTWTLGVHSYLAYLRNRLVAARELLTDTGSIFVQISDENVHLVRCLMDEVFGSSNFVALIPFQTTSGLQSRQIKGVFDLLIWYCTDKERIKYRQLYLDKQIGADTYYDFAVLPDGQTVKLQGDEALPQEALVFSPQPLVSGAYSQTTTFEFEYRDSSYHPGANRCWKTTPDGMSRVAASERIFASEKTLKFMRYANDFPVTEVSNLWTDAMSLVGKDYIVQTVPKVIERCVLMTTDPGDLVLDPTGGSGTTAYVAEQWGRRWITIDTSRVAVALARQRLLTAKFDYYQPQHPDEPLHPMRNQFVYKSVPHITLKSIAQNQALDPIFARWEPVLVEKLAGLNAGLAAVTPALRTALQAKLTAKERAEGKKVVSDADRRRWLLPKNAWQAWEVPFDSDPDWPELLRVALDAYRTAWRRKMDEVNATIAASAPSEPLVDQPQVVKNILRVSGPFTVEGVQPAEETLDLDTPIGGEPEPLETFSVAGDPTNAEAYLEKMIRLLRVDGVRFPDNKVVPFERLEPVGNDTIHAHGEWLVGGETRRVAVSFGPQYGPITAKQVEDVLWSASRRGYDDLVFAGFTIDGAAQATIQEDPNPRVRCHLAYIRPDVNIGGDLLKNTPSSQLFTVFGLPRALLEKTTEGEFVVTMEGVDIYDPITNTINATRADKVAAWFLDSDYDGATFCISQAFYPDSSAWEKLAKALKTVVDPARFEAFSGTTSLPFSAGKHGRAAVKIIDPRGNEVMRVLRLDGQVIYNE